MPLHPSSSSKITSEGSSGNLNAGPSISSAPSSIPQQPQPQPQASSSYAPVAATPRNQQSHRPSHRNRKKAGSLEPHRKGSAMRALHDDILDLDTIVTDENAGRKGNRNRGGRRNHQVEVSHLIHYESFQDRIRDRPSARRPAASKSYPTWGRGSGYHPADKAKYINANYRFVVKPEGDYAAIAADPDSPVPWSDILQILAVKSTQASSCPICLTDVPVAPRMLKCGHILCLACLLRYQQQSSEIEQPSSSSKSKRKICPLCYDYVDLSDTRPVKWIEQSIVDDPATNSDVKMKLMFRTLGSPIALPRDEIKAVNFGSESVPWYFMPKAMQYARIVKGSQTYVLSEYVRELTDIENDAQTDEALYGITSSEFSQMAEQEIRKSMQNVGNICSNAGEEDAFLSYSAATPGPAPSSDVSRSYYFYQSNDAKYQFLAPLDVKILRAEFGTYSDFPSNLLVRVEHVTGNQTVDDELRKHHKYLSYLPSGCQIAFLECDWKSIVSDKVLHEYQSDIVKRRKLRREKEKREERERERWERQQDRKQQALLQESYQRGRVVNYHEESIEDFTNYNPSLIEDKSNNDSNTDELQSSSSPPAPAPPVWNRNGISFSKIAKREASAWDIPDIETMLAQKASLEEQPDHHQQQQHQHQQQQHEQGRKKKGRKKVVLLSTSGHIG